MPINVDEKYFGYDGFIWFIGVVEDINDPEQISRVKVRILGHHTEDKKTLKTKDMMWAVTMMPTTSASVSGVGISPSGLVKGSYVFGFWMDGEHAQRPVIIGSWHGIPQDLADPNVGFNDPDGVYPKEVNEPDTNKLARGENTITDVIDGSINNPPSAYAAVYPYNKVYGTESGHSVEFDDTPEAERIRIAHSSGTNIEIRPNGDVTQINGNRWNITLGNDQARVSGSLKIVVDGNADITVGNNAFMTVENDVSATVGKTMNAIVGEKMNIDCPTTNWTGDINLTGNVNISGTSTAKGDHVSGSANISGKGHTHIIAGGSSAGETKKPSGE
jgi:hypothetical protein